MFRKILSFLCIYLVSSLTLAEVNEDEKPHVIDIPFYDSNRPPLIFVGERYSGIHAEILMKVLTETGIKFNFQPTPHSRRRILFEAGEVVLDCCSNPEWRQRPIESQLQIFSTAIDDSADHYIFNKSQQFSISSYSELNDKVVGIIRGFSYSGSEHFGPTVEVKTEEQLLDMLDLNRIDLAIVNKQVAEYYIKKKRLNLVVGPLHDKKTLHIRLNRSHAALLPKLNRTIEELINSGARDRIIQSYVGR